MIKHIFYLLPLLSIPVHGEIFELSWEQCRQLVIAHKPRGNIAYTPGIDVAGQPVAPADLPGSKHFDIGKSVTISIDLPLRKYAPHFPKSPHKNNYIRDAVKDSSIHTGEIQIAEDNSVWINGEPVHDEVLDKIDQECRAKFPDL